MKITLPFWSLAWSNSSRWNPCRWDPGLWSLPRRTDPLPSNIVKIQNKIMLRLVLGKTKKNKTKIPHLMLIISCFPVFFPAKQQKMWWPFTLKASAGSTKKREAERRATKLPLVTDKWRWLKLIPFPCQKNPKTNLGKKKKKTKITYIEQGWGMSIYDLGRSRVGVVEERRVEVGFGEREMWFGNGEWGELGREGDVEEESHFLFPLSHPEISMWIMDKASFLP